MNRLRFLEVISTKYLVITILLLVSTTVIVFALILGFRLTDVTTLATFVDAVFKTVALLVGAIWALNRYYVGRMDATQLRVDTDVSLIPSSKFEGDESNSALLVYRLDVVNTGRSLIPEYQQYLEIKAVYPSREGIQYKPLYRWPSVGLHPGGPIEPGSWSAINAAISVPPEVKAVHLYLELKLSETDSWNWHKTFDVSKEAG